MNERVTVGAAGAVTLGLGLGGLARPGVVLWLVGFGAPSESHLALALGEVRATYGGLLVALGASTLWAALDPRARRDWIVLAGLLWLGVACGRLFSASLTGNPGVFGWLFAAFELAMGGALVFAAMRARDR